MRQIIIILTTLFFLSSCCDILCKRQNHAEMIIEKVEVYRKSKGKLPEKVTELGIDDKRDHLSYYKKKSEDEYEIWYGLRNIEGLQLKDKKMERRRLEFN